MDALALARWQFGITTVYHFLFVPMTIGLTWLVAVMQTKWTNSGNVTWYRLTRLFGKLFLINFAAGVVTGIVQEFQFGMNWSEYSRFVGDIFGAPLALEALIAFFMESTFVGLWIFGWNKLPKKVHLAMIYLTAIGTTISSIFILAANAWMQNPVGAKVTQLPDGSTRAELTNFLDLVTNPFFLTTFPHVIGASFMLAGGLVVGVAGWWLVRGRRSGVSEAAVKESTGNRAAWYSATRFGAWIVLVASLVTIVVGDIQGKVEAQYQPAKLAASEGLANTPATGDGAPFVVLTVFTQNDDGTVASKGIISLPGLLSFLAFNDSDATVQGINDLQTQLGEVGYQPIDGTDRNALQQGALDNGVYTPATIKVDAISMPALWVSFYSFRIMVLIGFLGLAFAIAVLVKTRKDCDPKPTKAWNGMMVSMVLLPLFGSSFGWLLTEIGRQPWIVNGVLPTSAAVSPSVSGGEVLVSMILYTLVYAVVAVIVVNLFLKTIRQGLPDVAELEPSATADGDEEAVLHFAY